MRRHTNHGVVLDNKQRKTLMSPVEDPVSHSDEPWKKKLKEIADKLKT